MKSIGLFRYLIQKKDDNLLQADLCGFHNDGDTVNNSIPV